MSTDAEPPAHLAEGKPASEDDLIVHRRYRLVRRLAPPSGRVLLDFGCGNGAQTRLFTPHFSLTIGVDVNESSLGRLRRTTASASPGHTVCPILYDGSVLPIADRTVDYVVSFEVLEHVRQEAQTLSELGRVMRPGGILAISVPNRWWVFETHGADLPLLPWNRIPFFSWLPKPIHDRFARARIYTRREIVGKLERHGFSVVRSMYITAPMDVVKWPPLQNVLRRTCFRGDHTPAPVLATSILAVARRRVDGAADGRLRRA